MTDVVSAEHLEAARGVRRVLAVWNDIEDLVNIGAYAAGTNVEFDVAVAMKPEIDLFLQQAMRERAGWTETQEKLLDLESRINASREQLTAKAGRNQPVPTG